MKKLITIYLITLLTAGLLTAQQVEDFSGQSAQSGFLDNINKDFALYNNPHGIDIGPKGTIYIADRFNHSIRKIDTNGVVTTIAGNGTVGNDDGDALSASFHEPWDVCAGNNGEVYVADAKNNKIRVITTDGQVSTFAGTGSGGFTDNSNPLASSFFWPSGLEYNHETGDLYVAGHLSHLIRKISSAGVVTTYAGTKTDFPNNFGSVDGIASQSKFYRPYGIHLGNNGELFIADEWNDQIRVITADGIVNTLGGQPDSLGYKEGSKDSSLFNFPWDVTTDANGFLYVLDGNNHVVRKINPETGFSEFFAGGLQTTGSTNDNLENSRFNGATGIEYYKGSLYIADAFNHVIRRIILLEKPTLSVSEEKPCLTDTVTLSSNLDYYDKYFWYHGNDLIATTTSPEFEFIITDTRPIIVRAERNGIGIVTSDTLELVQVVQQEEIILNAELPFCEGDTLELSATHDSVLWSTNEQSENIEISTSGTYSFELFENGCMVAQGDTTITFSPRPIIDVTPKNTTVEFGDSVNVVVSGTDVYTWSNGKQTSSVFFDEGGTYYVTGKDTISGCFSDRIATQVDLIFPIEAKNDTIELTFRTPNQVQPLLNDETTALLVYELLNTSDLPFKLNIFGEVIELENYTVLTDSVFELDYKICIEVVPSICDTGVIFIQTLNSEYSSLTEPFFPDAFSPNEDGFNDRYEIIGLDFVLENQFQVHNRWGQLLYETDNYRNDWNGKNQSGEDIVDGTYFYSLIDKTTNKKYVGYVVIKR